MTYTYDTANRLISAGGVAHTWDNNGDLLNDGSATYGYDFENRLISTTLGGVNTQFAYNGDGIRLRLMEASTLTTYTQDYAAPLPVVLQAKTSSASTQYVYSLGTRPVPEYEAGAWEYLLADPLGSVRQIADASGNVTLLKSYEPYGSVLNGQGSGASIFSYAGEQIDGTGLIYLRARYMQPTLGVFLSRDVWEGDALRPGSMNGWNYVEGNPVNQADPGGDAICLPPNYWQRDPETGQLKCAPPPWLRDPRPPLPPGGFGEVGVLNPPIGGTNPNIGIGTGTQVLIGIGVLLCAAIIEDLQEPHPNVIVELGAGDYFDNVTFKLKPPSPAALAAPRTAQRAGSEGPVIIVTRLR